MQPPQQQPMGSSQPYYGYQPPMQAAGPPMMINKRIIFMVVALGALLVWIAQVAGHSFGVTDTGTLRALLALYYTGAAIGVGGCVLGALGSPRTDGHQNLGLLVLAGFLVLALTARPF